MGDKSDEGLRLERGLRRLYRRWHGRGIGRLDPELAGLLIRRGLVIPLHDPRVLPRGTSLPAATVLLVAGAGLLYQLLLLPYPELQ